MPRISNSVGTSGVEKLRANDEVPCKVCGESIRLRDMRSHVGHHILPCFRPSDEASGMGSVDNSAGIHSVVSDDLLADTQSLNLRQSGTEPCGFCGMDAAHDKGCKTQLTLSDKRAPNLRSTCEYFYSSITRNFENKKVYNESNRCTNHPMHCSFCPKSLKGLSNTVWSYNFMLHVWERHSSDGDMPDLPPQTWVECLITRAEETHHGISQHATDKFRADNQVIGSEEVANLDWPPESDDESDLLTTTLAKRRGRAGTESSVTSNPREKKQVKRCI
jgi:hypothetical protein